ncbi:MAG: FAD-dependent oxidoreductase [Luminiphilus sp.]|jgi:rubredoxin---NAD+ reductase|nr:FAD-dependent oxidoreductase [Luminiphilus sp.]
MARWECIVCGLIYDEKEGWPEDGIAPGTKWEDVPEDWTCPDCGVGKDDFELIPGSDEGDEPAEASASAPEATLDARSVVVIGSGLAGYGLVRELRRKDDSVAITVLTSDGGEGYSKPMISTGYTKDLSAEKLAAQSAQELSEQLKVTVRTRTQVASVDTNAQLVILEGGETLPYSELVLALGAELIRPPIGGDAADQVLGVNDLDDYRRFQDLLAAKGAKKIAIIGAGLIGCEFANDLLNGGFTVEAVDPMGWCLPTLLPEQSGRAVQAALEEKGATFHFGPLATEVNRSGEGYVVTLNNGDTIEADAVLCAVGVKPRTGLASDAGIELNRGIVTDRQLRTSAPNVYAMGDCAEVSGHVLVYVAPLMAAARALAATLAGEPTDVSYPAMPVAIKTPACPVVVSPPAKDAEGDWHFEGEAPDIKALFRSGEGGLLGFALTGQAVKERMALTKELPAIL